MIRFALVVGLGFAYTIPLFIIFYTHSLFFRSTRFRHSIARNWSDFILKVAGTKIKVIGEDNISPNQAYLFLANHQSSFDIYSLLSTLNCQFRFVSKMSYFKLPIIGYSMKHLGHIPVLRESVRSAATALRLASQNLKEGFSVLLFPEGTRSEDGEILPFKVGPIKIVELSKKNMEVVPITLVGSRNVQPKGRWMIKKAEVKIIIGSPLLVTKESAKNKKESIATLKQLENIIRQTYDKHKVIS